MGAVGVFGLMVGVWVAATGPCAYPAGQVGRGDFAARVLGWLLAALSVVLVLTSAVPANPAHIVPSNCKLAEYCVSGGGG